MLNETYRAMLGNKSVIRETFMYGKKRAAEIGYENVFDYSLGNPSVPCPPEFTAAMQDLLANEEPVNLHGYCPSQGDPGFRAAVAAHLAKTFGLPYEQKHIFPKALEEDANAFCLKAREFDLLLVPSATLGVKGYVRLAYCIDTEKVKRSLPALEKLAAAYRK